MFNNKFKNDSIVEAVKKVMEDGDCVTKPEAKKIAKKEVSHHNVTMHKGQKDTTKEETSPSFKDKLISNLMEREMTSKEAKKKEHIVMSMKDKQDYFKKKYGKRWKEVMYATATKQAMKKEDYELDEEVEELDEKRGQSSRSDKEAQAMDAAKQTLDFMKSGGKIEVLARKRKKKEISTRTYKPGMGEEVELGEEESGLRMAAHAAAKEGKKMFSFKGRTMPVTVKKEEVEDIEEKVDPKKKTVDMLRGREKVSADYHNQHKDYKIQLSAEAKQPEQDNVPFTPDASKPADVKDKSGAVHTPMSRARHLARTAMAKLKKEMMGKTGTSE